MRNKIIAACVALVAFAALPSMANAIVLREEGGVLVNVGSKIEATNEGNTVFSGSFGKVECTKSTLTGEVTVNGTSAVEGNITAATYTGEEAEGKCSSAFFGPTKVTITSLPWCLRTTSKSADKAELRGGNCSEAAKNLEFTLDSSIGNCTYRAASVTSNEYVTGQVPGTLKFENQPFTGISAFPCPTTGSFTGAYILETDESTTGVGIFKE